MACSQREPEEARKEGRKEGRKEEKGKFMCGLSLSLAVILSYKTIELVATMCTYWTISMD